MTILLFIALFAVIGAVLYLPFFLWFRRRPPRASGAYSTPIHYTPAGWLFVVAQLATLFAGLAFHDRRSSSAIASLFEGDAGLLKWWACNFVGFTALGRLLRGAGVALERPAVAEGAISTDAAAAPIAVKSYRIATIRGIPILVQRSYLFGGLFFALIAQAGPAGIAGYCLAYAALFALHESGHVVAARALGLRVHAVNLSAIGGACVVQLPRRPRDAWIVYSAGFAVQVALWVATAAVVALSGPPAAPFGIAVVTTFTWINVLVFAINLVPGSTSLGPRTDGAALWQLAMHQWRGAPHPLAGQIAASPVFDPATGLLDIEGFAPAGFRHGIEILNDDTTPMAFVVDMLHRHAGLDTQAAADAMLAIHQRGGLLLPLQDRAAADAVAAAILREARAQRRQLVCRAVSASE
jgi:ATP-dependent Clp protease adapter protein ClpS